MIGSVHSASEERLARSAKETVELFAERGLGGLWLQPQECGKRTDGFYNEGGVRS